MSTFNPLAMLDKVLAEYASPKARRAIHAALMLVAGLVTLWLAYDKNWMEALIALAATVYAGANKANTHPEDTEPEEPEPEDEAQMSLIFDGVPSGALMQFGDEDDHGDEADHDYGIVRASAAPPHMADLPTETVHGGTGSSE
jgi:hypothetical protein